MIQINLRVAIALLTFAAAPVVFAASTNVPCTGIALTNTELAGSVTCPQFSGSNLTQIDIVFNGAIEGSITLTNNAVTDQDVEATTQSQFNLGLLGGFVIPVPLFTASFGTGVVPLGAGASQTFSGLSGSGNGAITNTDTGTFGLYTGVGTFSIPVSTLTGISIVGGGGQVASIETTQAGIEAEVTYTFGDEPPGDVPEPSSLALTGIGAVALGMAARRRRPV